MSEATTLSPQIAGIMANRLRTTIHAERVWLFGSLARGHAGIDSDIDLLAVVPASSVSRYQRAVAARRELASFNIPMDIIVMTHDEWEKELKAPSSLASTVSREGIPV
jgi:predicted nucleotidyltransferase